MVVPFINSVLKLFHKKSVDHFIDELLITI